MRGSSSAIAEAAAIARRQHGVVTRAQLLALAGTTTLDRWVGRGLLHPEHPGVYRFGHRAPSTEARYLAAVLAAGEQAALCRFAAAHLYESFGRRAPAPEVTGRVDLRLRGVLTRRLAPLGPGEVHVVEGIRVTSPARTIVDLAGAAALDVLAEISHHLRVRHGIGGAEVAAVVERRGRVNGAARLRALYEGDAEILLSRLEKRFARLLRKAGLPRPLTNRRTGSFYVDCRWPGFTVELLGFRFHSSRHAWTRDAQRQREAYARGDEFRTYTWDDVTLTPEVVLAELTPLLRADRAG